MKEKVEKVVAVARVALTTASDNSETALAKAQARASAAVTAAKAVWADHRAEKAQADLGRRVAVASALAALGWGDLAAAAEAAVAEAKAAAQRAAAEVAKYPQDLAPTWRAIREGEDLIAAGEAFAAAAHAAARGRILQARGFVIAAAVLSATTEDLFAAAEGHLADFVKPTPPTNRPEGLWALVSELASLLGIWSAGVTRRHAMTGPHWTQAAEAAGLADLA